MAVIFTVTDFTTVRPPTASPVPSSLTTMKTMQSSMQPSITKSSPPLSTLISPKQSSTSSVSSASSIQPPDAMLTSTPPLPSGWTEPSTLPSKSVPNQRIFTKDNTLANIVLASIILIVVLYLFLVLYGIALWWKGKCPKCKSMEEKMRKMEEGGQIRVTKEMVRNREASTAEKDKEISFNRASALNALNGNGAPQSLSGSERQTLEPIWARQTGAGNARGRERVPTPGPESGLGHGNHYPTPPSSVHLGTTRPQSSTYSQEPRLRTDNFNPGNVYRNNRNEIISHFEPYMEGAPAPNLREARGYERAMEAHHGDVYLRAYEAERQNAEPEPSNQDQSHAAARATDPDNPDAEDARKYADRLLQNIRQRGFEKGQRLYGGLPLPDGFGVDHRKKDEGGKWTKVKNALGFGK